MTNEFWQQLYDTPWPGADKAFLEMALEIHALRLLTDEVVGEIVTTEAEMRSKDEIQRAHDIVGKFCVDNDDAVTMEHVSALCWVLRHDHNTAFPQILEAVEKDLERRGIVVVRLPEVVDPRAK